MTLHVTDRITSQATINLAASLFTVGGYYTIDIVTLDDTMTVYVDGSAEDTATVTRTSSDDPGTTVVYMGDPWYTVADVELKNLR